MYKHFYTEYICEEEKSELIPTCTRTVSLPLSYIHTYIHTYKHAHTQKATSKAETGRTQTVRHTEYFIMFLLACQERQRSTVCVFVYVQI